MGPFSPWTLRICSERPIRRSFRCLKPVPVLRIQATTSFHLLAWATNHTHTLSLPLSLCTTASISTAHISTLLTTLSSDSSLHHLSPENLRPIQLRFGPAPLEGVAQPYASSPDTALSYCRVVSRYVPRYYPCWQTRTTSPWTFISPPHSSDPIAVQWRIPPHSVRCHYFSLWPSRLHARVELRVFHSVVPLS